MDLLSPIRDRFIEAHHTPWDEVSPLQFGLTALFTAWICYLGNTGERWVHLLDGANLMFHEAGHPMFGALNERLTVYGGTLGQLFFPIACSLRFWLKRSPCSFAICVIWFFENIWNIDRYLSDARAQVLPLVGDGTHDWTEILTRWGMLEQDVSIANKLHVIGWVGILLTCYWLYGKIQKPAI
jgi:hypothetical protein